MRHACSPCSSALTASSMYQAQLQLLLQVFTGLGMCFAPKEYVCCAALPRCGPGPERSARGQGGAGEDARAREWTLVRALGAARGAPPDGAYLAALAARGSWVRLLAEADSQAYPLRLVRSGPCTLLGFLMPPAHMQALGLCRMSSADCDRAGRWKPCGWSGGAGQ